MSFQNIINELKNFSTSLNLELPEDVSLDGSIKRYSCSSSENSSKKDEWYVGNILGDHVVATIGTYKGGMQWHTYRSWQNEKLTPEQIKEFNDKYEQHITEVKLIEAEAHKSASDEAKTIWDKSVSCTTHPYLEKKKVLPYGCRMNGNYLIIPVYDAETDQLQSLQFIDPDGKKRFLKGGKMSNGYFQIGEGEDFFVGEGFSTCATVTEATNKPSINAFSASNCCKVALHLRNRKKINTARLLQDWGEAGDKVADQWEKHSIGDVCKPSWLLNERPNDSTDWNDLAKDLSKEEVLTQLEPKGYKTFSIQEFFESDDEPESWAIENLMTRGSVNIIHARGGVGKSLLATDLGFCCAAGLEAMNGWKCERQRVLVIDGELPAPTLKERWKMSFVRWSSCKQDLEMGDIEILPWLKVQHDSKIDMNLFCPISRNYLDKSIEKADFIILDNFDSLTLRDGSEDFRGDETNWTIFFRWARKWASLGKTFCIVMHSTKGSSLAGSRRISGDASTIIKLDPLRDELRNDPFNTAFIVTIPKGRTIQERYKAPFAVEMLKPDATESHDTPWLRHSLADMVVCANFNKDIIKANSLENFIKPIY